MANFTYKDPVPPTAQQETDNEERNRLFLEKRAKLLHNNPFDPRTEVSADAQHVADKIIRHMWIIFVLLPIVSVILFELVK